jgi:hypothetical protein
MCGFPLFLSINCLELTDREDHAWLPPPRLSVPRPASDHLSSRPVDHHRHGASAVLVRKQKLRKKKCSSGFPTVTSNHHTPKGGVGGDGGYGDGRLPA